MTRTRSSRFVIIIAIFIAVFAILIYSIIVLHHSDIGQRVREKGALKMHSLRQIDTWRGNIVDRDHRALAISVPVIDVILNPYLLLHTKRLNKPQLHQEIARALNLNSIQFKRLLNKYRTKRHYRFKTKLEYDDAMVTRITELKKNTRLSVMPYC